MTFPNVAELVASVTDILNHEPKKAPPMTTVDTPKKKRSKKPEAETITAPDVDNGAVIDPTWPEVADASTVATAEAEEFSDTIELPLSETEEAALHADLIATFGELKTVKNHQKDLAATKAEIVARQNDLVKQLQKGEKPTDVISRMVFSTNTVESRRKDTGEVVHTRSITAEERQTSLKLVDPRPDADVLPLFDANGAFRDSAEALAPTEPAPSATDIVDPDGMLEGAADEDEGL